MIRRVVVLLGLTSCQSPLIPPSQQPSDPMGVPSATPATDYASRGYPRFGTIVGKAGDVNGDGTPDLIIGDPGMHHEGVAPRFWIVSGKDGSVLRSVQVPSRKDVEYRAEGGVDLDGDGVPDFLVSASSYSTGEPSTLYLISGKTGLVLRSIATCACGFGSRDSVHFISDFDHDGVVDIGLLCPVTSERHGTLFIYSGKSGDILAQVSIENECSARIGAFAEVGDLDADAVSDFAMLLDVGGMDYTASMQGASASGVEFGGQNSLRLYSAARQHKIWERVSKSPSPVWRLASLTQLGNIEGVPVLVAGFDETVELVDCKSGECLRYFENMDKGSEVGFGCAVAALGDIDRDGVPDFAFSVWESGLFDGKVVAKSGKDGRTIWTSWNTLKVDDIHHLGRQLAPLGDIDGDAICDLAAAADMGPSGEPGVAEVLSGKNGSLIFEFKRKGDDVIVTRRAEKSR